MGILWCLVLFSSENNIVLTAQSKENAIAQLVKKFPVLYETWRFSTWLLSPEMWWHLVWLNSLNVVEETAAPFFRCMVLYL